MPSYTNDYTMTESTTGSVDVVAKSEEEAIEIAKEYAARGVVEYSPDMWRSGDWKPVANTLQEYEKEDEDHDYD